MTALEMEIRDALRIARDKEERIAKVVPLLAKAIQTIPIKDFRIDFVTESGVITPEYSFGPTMHSVDKATSPKITSETMEGSFLSRGVLLQFAQAVWIGEKFIPHIWNDPGFRRNLALPTKHLDTVEELFWMGFWHTSIDDQSVISAHKMASKTKDVDWRFRCTTAGLSKWVNMEVKRRNTDVGRLLPRGEELSRPFADISQKFTKSQDDEINVAAITLYGSGVEQIAARAEKWLQQNSNVDCVLLWNNVTCEIASIALPSNQHKLQWLRTFLEPPSSEGLVAIGFWHPIDIGIMPNHHE